MSQLKSLAQNLNSLFVRVTDGVSYAMGTPPNILFWLTAVGCWFVLFALNPQLQNSSFLPAWFTSNAFNFPLNTVTTLAELYIGFLVAAATNRAERALVELIQTILQLVREVKQINEQQNQLLQLIQENLARQDTILALLQADADKELAEDEQIIALLTPKPE